MQSFPKRLSTRQTYKYMYIHLYRSRARLDICINMRGILRDKFFESPYNLLCGCISVVCRGPVVSSLMMHYPPDSDFF